MISTNITIETDCLVVTKVVLQTIDAPLNISSLIEDSQVILNRNSSISISYIDCDCNEAVITCPNWVFDVIGSGSGSILEVPPAVQKVCFLDKKFGLK